MKWSIKHGREKSEITQLFKLILAECIYVLWVEPNYRIFERRSRNIEQIAKEIAYITVVRSPTSIKNVLNMLKF